MDASLKGYEEKAGEWYSHFGWKGNPLDAKTIMPELIVGLEKERKFLLQYIVNGGGYVLIKGPVGAGKTTLCRWLEGEMKTNPGYASVFFEEPPRNSKDVDYRIISALEGHSFVNLRRLLGQKPTEFVTPEFLSEKLEKKGRIAVVFLDEAHIFESPEIAYRIKDIVDMNVNCRLVISGIQTHETDVESLLPDAIVNRVSPVNRLLLENLTKDEAKQLVLKRIESFGGKDFSPFDEKAIEIACDIFGGAPRSFLLFLSYCIDCAIEDGTSEIKGEGIMRYAERYGALPKMEKNEEKVESSIFDEFSDTQLQIMKSLSKQPMQTVKELASHLKINEEPARTQLKRINSKCRQMGIQDALGSRKDEARKSYVFWLNDHIARLFAKE